MISSFAELSGSFALYVIDFLTNSGISSICVNIRHNLFSYVEHFETVCSSAKFLSSEIVWSVNVGR